jgi:hypothetical protein
MAARGSSARRRANRRRQLWHEVGSAAFHRLVYSRSLWRRHRTCLRFLQGKRAFPASHTRAMLAV